MSSKLVYHCDRCNNQTEDNHKLRVNPDSKEPRENWDLCYGCLVELYKFMGKDVVKEGWLKKPIDQNFIHEGLR